MKHTKDGPYINSYLISTPTGLQISLYRKLYQSAIYWYRGRVWVLYITQYEYIRIRHYVTRCHLPHIFLEVIRHCSRRFDNNHPYLIPQKKDMWQGYRFANICCCICLSTRPKIIMPQCIWTNHHILVHTVCQRHVYRPSPYPISSSLIYPSVYCCILHPNFICCCVSYPSHIK